MTTKHKSFAPLILLGLFVFVAMWTVRMQNSIDGVYVQNILLRDVLSGHQHWTHSASKKELLLVTWFLAGRVNVQMWTIVGQDGKYESHRLAIYSYSLNGGRSGAIQNSFWKHLSEKKIHQLRRIINQIPEDSISKNNVSASSEKLFILSVNTQGRKETHFYDKKHLPPKITQIAKVLDINIS